MLASQGPQHRDAQQRLAASGVMQRPHGEAPGMVNPLLGFQPLGANFSRSHSQSNDDMNGSDMESDVGSENEDINDIDSDKLDASHREILEKLKRQEQEEREEIERELKEAQRGAFARAQRHEEIRAQELRARDEKDRAERGGSSLEDSLPTQTEIKTQRPLGLLAQHGLTTKSHHSHGNLAAMGGDKGERSESRRGSPVGDKDSEPKENERRMDRDHVDNNRDALEKSYGGGDRMHGLGLNLPGSGPGMPDFPHPAFLDTRAFGGPQLSHPTSPSSPGTPGLTPGPHDRDIGSAGTSTPGHHWTFEEQFKQLSRPKPPRPQMTIEGMIEVSPEREKDTSLQQSIRNLYELSEDPKRKEFLDDLFSFMQKRGTPVNRIPIMAKQTLDLYELFRLVVSKGGLVEVINKKLWREITKGLNLPSSITSAAFTLRTQYMKYLYPYECEKLKLSNPAELQAAIDGNRREGRRPSYGYDFSPIPTMMPTPPPPHMNGGFPHPVHALNGRPNNSPKDDDRPLHTPPNHTFHSLALAERDARAMDAAARAMEEATRRMEEATRVPPVSSMSSMVTGGGGGGVGGGGGGMMSSKHDDQPPPPKRPMMDADRLMPHVGVPSAHLKITSRGDGRAEFDNSLVVSMEINGIMYQGVLFAQHPRRL